MANHHSKSDPKEVAYKIFSQALGVVGGEAPYKISWIRKISCRPNPQGGECGNSMVWMPESVMNNAVDSLGVVFALLRATTLTSAGSIGRVDVHKITASCLQPVQTFNLADYSFAQTLEKFPHDCSLELTTSPLDEFLANWRAWYAKTIKSTGEYLGVLSALDALEKQIEVARVAMEKLVKLADLYRELDQVIREREMLLARIAEHK